MGGGGGGGGENLVELLICIMFSARHEFLMNGQIQNVSVQTCAWKSATENNSKLLYIFCLGRNVNWFNDLNLL